MFFGNSFNLISLGFSSVFVIIIIISCVLTFFRILLVFYLPVINDFFMEI